jgi:chromosomal replication initiation ATPase DnaA
MITEIEKRLNISADEILGNNRKMDVSIVRQLYWKLLKEKKGFSYSEIARLNGRDYSTIIYGIKRVNGFLEMRDKMATELWEKMKDIQP